MMQKIQQFDVQALIFFNRKLSHQWLDAILPWFRDSVFWIPLYIFLISWGILNLGKKAVWWVAWGILTIALSDQIGGLIKNSVARIRPCRNPEVLPLINLRVEHCSGAFSFTSNHAANHFAMAIFVFSSLAPVVGTNLTRWLFLWAASIGFAQVYVGVHYPLDVVGGALLGLACGRLTSGLYLWKAKTIARLDLKS